MNSNDALSKFTEIIYDYWREKKYNEITKIIILLLCFSSLGYMYLFLYNRNLFLSLDFLKLFFISIFLNSGFFIILYLYNDNFYKKLKSICGEIEDDQSAINNTEEELSIELKNMIKQIMTKCDDYNNIENEKEESEYLLEITSLIKESIIKNRAIANKYIVLKKNNAFIETSEMMIVILTILYSVYFIKIVINLNIFESKNLVIIFLLLYLIKDSMKKIKFIIKYNRMFYPVNNQNNLKLRKKISKIKNKIINSYYFFEKIAIYILVIIISIILVFRLFNIININQFI